MRKMLMGLCFLVGAGVFATAAAARDVALVIGNAAYEHVTPLKSPVNDAREMANVLRDLDFEVFEHHDLNGVSMGRALRNFGQEANEAETAVVFFAGYGMQLARYDNFVIPVDAQLVDEKRAELESVQLQDLQRAAAGARRLSLVIFDACRESYFKTDRRLTARGMAPTSPMSRQIVAFSTRPGEVAMDGFGRLSPYTQALTERLRANPDEDLRVLLTSIGPRVTELAQAEQIPDAVFGADLPATYPLTLATPDMLDSGPRSLTPLPPPTSQRPPARTPQEAFDLGRLYLMENGVPRDAGRAAHLWLEACEGGEGRGCDNLGLLYEIGIGVPKDKERAEALRRRAQALYDGDDPCAGPGAGTLRCDAVGKAIDLLDTADFAYNIVREMTLDRAVTISLALTVDPGSGHANDAVKGLRGTIRQGSTLASPWMEAGLSGAGFAIAPQRPDHIRQRLVPGPATRWDWHVTPEQTGEDMILTLDLYALVTLDGQEGVPIRIRTLRETIAVRVTLMDQLLAAAKDTETLVAFGGGAALLWGGVEFFRRRKWRIVEKKAEKEEEAPCEKD